MGRDGMIFRGGVLSGGTPHPGNAWQSITGDRRRWSQLWTLRHAVVAPGRRVEAWEPLATYDSPDTSHANEGRSAPGVRSAEAVKPRSPDPAVQTRGADRGAALSAGDVCGPQAAFKLRSAPRV